MPVRKRKPTSPGRRFQTVADFSEISRDRPERSLTKPKPRTKDAIAVLESLELRAAGARDDRVLLVLDNTEEVVWKSFRNLGDRVKLVLPRELNAYDVLVSDWVVFSRDSLDKAVAHFGGEAAESAESDGEEAEEAEEAEEPA